MSSEHASHTTQEHLANPAATRALAARLAQQLKPGDVVGLCGELGAGKTEFTRGLAEALGVPPDQTVCSPSFVMLHVYEGARGPLAHFDAYFLSGEEELEQAGFLDLRREGAIVVIEWADRVLGALPDDVLWVELEHVTDGRSARHGRGLPSPRAS